LVVLPHSVFALPFALASLLVATAGRPSLRLLALVVAAMVLARTAAMAYNRFLDAPIDARNPRTLDRSIPTGKVRRWEALSLAIFSAFAFMGVCSLLNPLAHRLSPLALLVLFFYSHTKRFTWTTHLFLGLALGIAPVGAWVAATGELAARPFWLLAAVVCFLAGFDILYATWDEDFDRRERLHSWVTRWGLKNSLRASRVFHLLMVGFLAGFGAHAGLPGPYFIGVAVVGAILASQHRGLYRMERLTTPGTFRVSGALFRWNGWVAVLYLAVVGYSLWT
jgi:4-hydroxybenzoate polyprenyltransferase